MAKDHTADQPMPLEITSGGVLTWPDQPNGGRPYVEGRFTRHPNFTFEVECVDRPNERTYQNTRLAFLLITVDGVPVWAWSAPMEDDGDSYEWYWCRSGKVLVADILANLDVIYAHVDLPFAVAWRDLAGEAHTARFATEDALRAFLANTPHDWKKLLHITLLETTKPISEARREKPA
jgi:hypothetical protein